MKTNIKNRFYVYEWYNIETGEIFYVGKGTGRRLKSPNGRNRYFLRYKNKYNCDVRIVKDNLTNDESLELEAELIAKYKKENQPLTNLTDGGENPPALSGEKNGMYGKTHTDEVKKKLHDCNMGKHEGEKNHQFGISPKERMDEETYKIWQQKQRNRKFGSKNPNAKHATLIDKEGNKLFFDTVTECAQWLIDNNYTSAKLLHVMGYIDVSIKNNGKVYGFTVVLSHANTVSSLDKEEDVTTIL